MHVSIVSTLFYSAPHISDFIARVFTASEPLFESIELILVDDGSPDESASIVRRLAEADNRIVLITLTRNFGHHPAMLTGLKHATGDLVFMIDSDLEEDPAWLARFLKIMGEEKAELVLGLQVSRKGGWFEHLTGRIFYKLYAKLAQNSYPADQATARLMTRNFVDTMLKYPEREVCFSTLCELTGFKQAYLRVNKVSCSATTYTLKHKLRLAADTLVGSSTTPLRWIFFIGLSISALSFLMVIYLSLNWLLADALPSGWTSVMVSIWFLGGAIVASIGVVGHYVAMTLIEAKQRPISLIADIYNEGGKRKSRKGNHT